jgi:hypothetical protein
VKETDLNLPGIFTSCTRPKNIAVINKAVSIVCFFIRPRFQSLSFSYNQNAVPEIYEACTEPFHVAMMPVPIFLHKQEPVLIE